MAMVQVDLSEYDMLREAKKKAEEEVKELKSTIEGLKDKSRVIIQTKYKCNTIDSERIASEINMLIKTYGYAPYNNVKDIINSICLRSQMSIKNSNSCQYIGFDDVRVKVEEYYKKEIEQNITGCEEARDYYYKLSNSIEEDLKKKYSTMKDKLIQEYKKVIETKDTEINTLKDKITELSKSNEDKIAELKATIEEAEAKMRELTGVKKRLFSKIFNK